MAKSYSTGPIREFMDQLSSLERFKENNQESFDSLTEREVEVLSLIGEGKNNPAIAKQLDITRTTVQNHRANIREKLNVNKQTDFVKYALAYDLIQF
ncbi:MAG: LuxR C-terminal-related transcriptional regulator [Gracilimonas sp.]